VHFNLYPAIEQNLNIAPSTLAAAANDSEDNSDTPLPTKPFSQQSLLDCYRTRCSGSTGQNPDDAAPSGEGAGEGEGVVTWKDMWLDRFLGSFKMHSGPMPKGDGLRWRMGNGLYVKLQQKRAIVVSTPFISADVRDNERAAYAALLLFRPHESPTGLLTLGDTQYWSAVDLLNSLPKEELAGDGWAQITRAEQTSEESRELEEMCRRQDDATHPLPEGAADDDSGGPTAMDVEPAGGEDGVDTGQQQHQPLSGEAARSSGIFFASKEDLARARGFVKDQHAKRQHTLNAEMQEFDDAIAADAAENVGSGLPNQDISERRFNPRHVERLRKLHAEANDEQLTFLDCVQAGVTGAHPQQILAVLSGEGGTGKSTYCIEPAALFTRMLHGSKSVILAAPTNGAASIINGVTVNGAFRLTCYGKSRTDPTTAKGIATLREERDRLSKAKLLIIDEMSLVGLGIFAVIKEYLRTVFAGTPREHLPFGGIPVVIFSGDFKQLPPVRQYPIYRSPPAKAPSEQHEARAMFVQQFTHFFELKTNFRHRTDPFWAEMNRHARFHTAPSAFDLAKINARPRLTTAEALLATPGALRADALFTAWTRKEVAEINATALVACNRRGNGTFTMWATHGVPLRGGGRGERAYGGRRSGGRGERSSERGVRGAGRHSSSDDDDNSDNNDDDAGPVPQEAQAALASALKQIIDPLVLGRLMRYNPNVSEVDGRQVDAPGFRPPPAMKLAVGVRVRLAITSSVILGLTKGAQGTVHGFYFARSGSAPVPNASLRSLADAGRNPPWGVPVVLVQWDERFYRGESFLQSTPRVTPVVPLAFEVRLDGKRWTRCMVPLEPATASTIHSAQGIGSDQHVISPPDGGPVPLLYVQLSRSTTLAGTYVTAPLTAKHFTRGADSDESRAVETEYDRLRNLPRWQKRGINFL
jgi:hypothetical protein